MITHTEFLPDRVLIHYLCKLPWRSPDVYGVVEQTYATLGQLPQPPVLRDLPHECRVLSEEVVFLPSYSTFVCLQFSEWEESDDCRMQALLGGPYQASLENPS